MYGKDVWFMFLPTMSAASTIPSFKLKTIEIMGIVFDGLYKFWLIFSTLHLMIKTEFWYSSYSAALEGRRAFHPHFHN
jgi:hypothetical protein